MLFMLYHECLENIEAKYYSNWMNNQRWNWGGTGGKF